MTVRIYRSIGQKDEPKRNDFIDVGMGDPEVRFQAEFDQDLGEFRLLIDGECVYSDLRPDAA
jgi:hypothetical protein